VREQERRVRAARSVAGRRTSAGDVGCGPAGGHGPFTLILAIGRLVCLLSHDIQAQQTG